MTVQTNGSWWLARTPPPELTPLTEDVDTEVVVVGAGMAGLCTAWYLASAGRDVVVLDAGQVGLGVSGHTTAKVSALHDTRYASIASRMGKSAASAYARSQQEAVDAIERISTDLGIDCDFVRLPAHAYTRQSKQVSMLQAEAEAAAQAGLAASFVEHTTLPFDVAGAVRVEQQAQFDPQKFMRGLVDAMLATGRVRIHERSRVRSLDESSASPRAPRRATPCARSTPSSRRTTPCSTVGSTSPGCPCTATSRWRAGDAGGAAGRALHQRRRRPVLRTHVPGQRARSDAGVQRDAVPPRLRRPEAAGRADETGARAVPHGRGDAVPLGGAGHVDAGHGPLHRAVPARQQVHLGRHRLLRLGDVQRGRRRRGDHGAHPEDPPGWAVSTTRGATPGPRGLLSIATEQVEVGSHFATGHVKGQLQRRTSAADLAPGRRRS
jgi:hypothetical protein